MREDANELRLLRPVKLLTITFAIILSFGGLCCSRQHRIDRVSNPGNNPAAAININTANKTELERLPNIGETLARRIVEFREQNGPFRRPENLLLVDGISEKRFQEIRPLIKTE